MRLWSIHPKYLDNKGLVAVWRESLLAKKVLEGKTKGYKNHPQLKRFKDSNSPILLINQYLLFIFNESQNRGYKFDKTKINIIESIEELKIKVTNKQIEYEYQHLLHKLTVRDLKRFEQIKKIKQIDPNPLFEIKEGEIEDWEKFSLPKIS